MDSPSSDHRAGLWAAAERLAALAPDETALAFHRLEPFAARRLRGLGREVPESLVETERLGAAFALAAGVHLERARAAVEGPLLVFKGPELAARYPDASLRIARDLDLLVPDAAAAQRALVAAGFVAVGDPGYYADAPHQLPLAWPGLPVELEVHGRPGWPFALRPPAFADVLAGARPSLAGVEGVLAPAPEAHALLVAAHAWTHGPLQRLRDLLDVAVLAAESDPAELARLARAWRMEKLWRTTSAVAGALFPGAPAPRALRGWARNLAGARERTVLEQHVGRLVGWYSALPPAVAARAMLVELREDVTPQPGETWREKTSRSVRAVRNATVRRSEHERALGRRDDDR